MMNTENTSASNDEYVSGGKKSKINRYGWTYKEDQPGRFMEIDKNLLKIDGTYQRSVSVEKTRAIASEWSWVGFAAIAVGEREDGTFWVLDGQHRVMAAKKRSDIQKLPCMVFESDGPIEEAKGFLTINTARRPMQSMERFRAMIIAGDPKAIFVQTTLDRLGISISKSPTARSMYSIAWALDRSSANKAAFLQTMELVSVLCADTQITEFLLDGLFYIHTNTDETLANPRMRQRILKIGPAKLVEAAKRAAAFFVRGGARVWAVGMMEEINKGLRAHDRFCLKNSIEPEGIQR